MKMKANAVKYGKRSLIWLLIAVMLMGTLAACDPGELPEDTSADEATTTKPTETDPVDTDPVDTDESHSLTAVAATEATCTEDGNIAYWTCSHCEKLFGDAEGTTEVTVESIVVPAKGHTEEIIPAVEPTYDTVGASEGKKCSVCGEITLKPVEIPVKEDNWYSVTFVVPDVEGEPKTEKYKVTQGLKLGEDSYPERAGYKCDGWYDKAEGGEKVVFIPEGNTDPVILYARWSLITYHISYAEYKVNNNPSEYTTEQEIILQKPEWSGLVFTHWMDSTGQIVSEVDRNGNTIVKIPKGSTGNIVLTANWKTKQNLVTVYEDERQFVKIENKDDGVYQFVYPLGYIENVILDQVFATQSKSDTDTFELTMTSTETLTKEHAETISNSITESVMKSSQWSDVTEYGETYDINVGFTAGYQGGVENVVKCMVSFSGDIESGKTEDWKHAHSDSGEKEEGTEKNKTLTSHLAYSETISVTEELKIQYGGPDGEYRYVRTGTVHVFAIIVYDANTATYYFETNSYIDNIKGTVLYSPSKKYWDNSKVLDPIPYDIPMDEIVGTVNNGYYVFYDANSGEGKMPMTVFTNGQEYNLPANAFAREGYTFDGWTVEGSNAILNDGATIKDLAQAGKSVVLKAKWKEHSYTVHYDYHDGSGKVEPVLRKYSETYTLPEPTRTGYTFKGWSTNPNATVGEYEGNSEVSVLSAEDEGTVTLYAIWSANTYTIVYLPNDGYGSTQSSSHTYDVEQPLTANGFYRTGWDFLGWSRSPNGHVEFEKDNLSVINLTALSGDIIYLYAQWSIRTAKTYSVTNPIYVNTGIRDVSGVPVCDMSTVFDLGYWGTNNFTIVVRCKAQSDDDKKETATVGVAAASSLELDGLDDMVAVDSKSKDIQGTDNLNFTFTISADKFIGNPYFYIYFKEKNSLIGGASGWTASEIFVEIRIG